MAAKTKPGNDIYQLRAVLRGISPLIWRRLLVRADSSVADLHEVLQVAFGWEDVVVSKFSATQKIQANISDTTICTVCRRCGMTRSPR